jgi:transposase InsO family protein
MAASTGARLQRKAARTAVSAAADHSFRRCYGIQFTNQERHRYAFEHIFDRVCDEHGIEHRLTKIKHPWTNGQVERMNRTIKEATVKRFHYDDHEQLRRHLADFVSAYNFARRLKTLKGLTPYEFICRIWTKEPERFKLDPIHQMPGLNN